MQAALICSANSVRRAISDESGCKDSIFFGYMQINTANSLLFLTNYAYLYNLGCIFSVLNSLNYTNTTNPPNAIIYYYRTDGTHTTLLKYNIQFLIKNLMIIIGC